MQQHYVYGQNALMGFGHAFCGKHNLTLKWEPGQSPATDGTTIFMPKIEGVVDRDTFDSCCSDLIHEAAHLFFESVPQHKKYGKRSALHRDVFNIVIDVADEARIGYWDSTQYYTPGTRQLLEADNAQMMDWIKPDANGEFPLLDPKRPQHMQILFAAMMHVWGLHGSTHKDRTTDLSRTINASPWANNGDGYILIMKVSRQLAAARRTGLRTLWKIGSHKRTPHQWGVVRKACNEIIKLLRDANVPEPKKPSTREPGGKGDGGGKGGCKGTPKPGEKGVPESGTGEGKEKKEGKGEGEGQPGQGEGQPGEGQGQGQGEGTPEKYKGRAKGGGEREASGQQGANIAKTGNPDEAPPKGKAGTKPDAGSGGAGVGRGGEGQCSRMTSGHEFNDSGFRKLRLMMNQAVSELAESDMAPSRDGKHQSGVAIGDITRARIDGCCFNRPTEHADGELASVSVLLDGSGSMRSRISHVSHAAEAFAEAISAYGPVQRMVFGSGIMPLTSFRKASTSGGTPTSRAMAHALAWQRQQWTNRKFMLVVTDGGPDDPEATQALCKQAQREGVNVFVMTLGNCVDRVQYTMPGVPIITTNTDLDVQRGLMQVARRFYHG